MNKMRFWLILLWMVPSLVWADAYDSGAITLSTFFSMAPNDESLQMLAVLFGDVGGLLPTASYTVVGAMFGVFNKTVLVLGTIVMFYTLLISTINTAHEGEVMGKKWSSTWIPLRTVSGVALLAPMASGYSMIQVVTMWVVVQGAGAADLMWNTVTNYYTEAANPTAQSLTPPISVDNSDAFMSDLTNSIACELFFDAWSRNMLTANNPNLCCHITRWEFARSNTFWWDDWVRWVDTSAPATPGSGNPLSIASTTYFVSNSSFAAPAPDPGTGLTSSGSGMSQAHQNICGSWTFNVDDVTDPSTNQPLLTPADQNMIANAQYQGWTKAYVFLRGIMQPAMVQAQNDTISAFNNLDTAGVYNTTYADMKAAVTNYILATGSGPLSDATTLYNNTIKAVYPNLSVAAPPTDGSSWEELATQRGWMDAGSWYFYLANALSSGGVMDALQKQPVKTPPGGADTNTTTEWDGLGAGFYEDACNDAQLTATWVPKQAVAPCDISPVQVSFATSGGYGNSPPYAHGYWNFAISYPQAVSGFAQGMIDNGTYSGAEWLRLTSDLPSDSQTQDFFRGGIFAMGNGIVSFVINVINNGQTPEDQLSNDPIVNISAAGHKLLVGTEGAFLVTAIYMMGVNIGLTILAAVPGAGAVATTAATAISTVLLFVGPLLIAFMLLIWGAAATMAYYLPMIPYILFIFGSLGWIVGVLESMVAAPLVALGLVVPSQDELGRAGHAIMLITNIFLRPTLMIIGLVCSVFMVRIGVFLLNETFMAVLYVNAGGVTLFGSFAVLGLYFSLLMGLCQKSFSLIHEVPDKVLRWIGHQGQEQFGEAQGLQQAERGFNEGSQKGSQGAGAFGKGAMSLGENARASAQQRAMQTGGKGGDNSAIVR